MKFINKIHKIIYPITPKKFKNLGLKYAFNLIRNRKKIFITFHSRPKYADSVGLWSDKLVHPPKFAIIIQGPIAKDYDFTLETIKIYKKIFNSAIIILSTWENEREDKKYIEKINKENIEILFNKEPEYAGASHINHQITSSLAGIKKAKEMGAEYALKSRADQRIYGINTMEFFYNLAKTFPVAEPYLDKQKERIVSISLDSFKYRLYCVSDMAVFGNIQDMILYWSPDLDTRPDLTKECKTERDFAKLRVCDIYLSTEFLKKIGREPKWSLKDYWQVLADHFCIVDQQSINLIWNKYEKHKEYKYLKYNEVLNSQELTFREWFNIYSNLNNKANIPEHALDKPFRSKIEKP